MSAIGTSLYKFLTSAFSTLEWQLGSVIRELVAEPIIGLSEAATSAVNKEYTRLAIPELLNNPEEHSDEIDELFQTLGLADPQPTLARGTIRILLSSSNPVQIISGSRFAYNDIAVHTEQTYNLTPMPGGSTTDILLTQVGIDAYAAIVPVVSNDYGAALSAGTNLTWEVANADIYEVSVYSAISGGTRPYTAADKINVIRQLMFPAAFSCSEGILRVINALYPNIAVDCAFARVSTGGSSQVYVKTTAAPQVWEIPVDAENISGTTMTMELPATGVIDILMIDDKPIADLAANMSITKTARTWTVVYEDPAKNIKPAVTVRGLEDLNRIQAALDEFMMGTGLSIDLLPPTVFTASMYLPVSADLVDGAILTNIVNSVNATLLNTVRVGDPIVRAVLSNAGIGMNATGTYTLTNESNGNTTTNLSTADVSSFGISTPYAIYAYLDGVSLTNG